MLNRFIQKIQACPDHMEELQQFFKPTTVGSVSEMQTDTETYIKHLEYSMATNLTELFSCSDIILPIGQLSQHTLESSEVDCLKEMYKSVFCEYKIDNVSCLCHRFSRAKLCNKLYSSQMARSDCSSYVYANWLSEDGSSVSGNDGYRPGRINFFLKHSITMEAQNGQKHSVQSYLAYVEWYKTHPERRHFLPPVTSEFEDLSAATFIPICRIACRTAQASVHMDFTERPHNSGQAAVIIPIDFVQL